MGRLSGKVAIVTGAARGQGAAEAKRLALDGASVMLTDLNDEGGAVALEIGAHAQFMRHDVSNKISWDEVIAATLKCFGRIDILVNNAGIIIPKPLQETDEALFDKHHNVNQRGVFLGMLSVIEPMKEVGGGVIVNTSSAVGFMGVPGMFAYAASKWAVRGLSKCAAADLAPLKIRVNSIYPGLIDTPMIEANGQEANNAYIAQTPLKRIGTAEEIADLVAFLVSDEARYITGAEISIDGGMSL